MHHAPISFDQLEEIEAELSDRQTVIGMPVTTGTHEELGCVVLIRKDPGNREGVLISEHPHVDFLEPGNE